MPALLVASTDVGDVSWVTPTTRLRTTSAVVARRGHPLAQCRSLADLRQAQWMLNWTPADDPAPLDDVFSRYLREHAPAVHVAHSFVIAMSLIRQTDMLGLMAWPLVEAVAAREQLCVLPLAETLNETTTSLISRRGDPLSAAAQCFIVCFNTVVCGVFDSGDAARRRVFRSIDGLALADKAQGERARAQGWDSAALLRAEVQAAGRGDPAAH